MSSTARRTRLTLLAAVCVVALPGCSVLPGGDQEVVTGTRTVTASPTGSSTSSASTATSSSSSTPSSSTPTSTSTTGSSSSSTTAQRVGLPTDARRFADAFVRAWGISDRAAAEKYATSDAVSTLWASQPRGGSGWTYARSDVVDGSTQVTYEDKGTGAILYVVVDNATVAGGEQDAITSTSFDYSDFEPESDGPFYDSAGLPTSASAYADEFVRAWGAGKPSAYEYATDEVMATLSGLAGSTWTRTSVGDGSVSYRDKAGQTITLYLDTDAVSAGATDAVYSADVGSGDTGVE